MIDLHCHLLPGIDDGPKNLEDALELARLACRNGITHAVVTPHIIPGRYDNTPDSITAAFSAYSRSLQAENIPLRLGMAAEIRLDPVIIDMVERNTLPFLGEYEGYKLLLLEFPHGHIPPESNEMVQWLIKRNIKPLIAHPERNRAVIDKPRIIEPFIKAGCLLQITSGSLTGVFGAGPKKTAEKLLKLGWVSVMASDAHNMQTRPPEIESGRILVEKIVGKVESWAMVRERPMKFASQHFNTCCS